jgi:glycine hydroxymethyltransferase
LLDYNIVRETVKKAQPKVLVAGASAYPRKIDFEILGSIAQEAGIDLVVDMAHIAGLVAAGLHPTPIPYAAYTTSTTHKTLRGPRGGLILCRSDRLKAVNSCIFQGSKEVPSCTSSQLKP